MCMRMYILVLMTSITCVNVNLDSCSPETKGHLFIKRFEHFYAHFVHGLYIDFHANTTTTKMSRMAARPTFIGSLIHVFSTFFAVSLTTSRCGHAPSTTSGLEVEVSESESPVLACAPRTPLSIGHLHRSAKPVAVVSDAVVVAAVVTVTTESCPLLVDDAVPLHPFCCRAAGDTAAVALSAASSRHPCGPGALLAD